MLKSFKSTNTKHIILSVFLVIISINFIRTTHSLLKSGKRLDELRVEVSELDAQKKVLQESIKYKKTDEFVEEQARNVLNFVKEGEHVFVLKDESLYDEGVTPAKKSLFGNPANILGIDDESGKSTNFYLWYRLFF